jgi:hypothetical protein
VSAAWPIRRPQLAAIRNWDASTWLVARRPFTATQLSAMREFAAAYGFDPVYTAGTPFDPAQRFHVLEPPYLFDGTQALLSPRARDYVRGYRFAITPARDDRPYFGDYFRWRSLPELWRLRGQGSAVLLDAGYLLLVAALVQAVPLAMLLVPAAAALPAAFARRARRVCVAPARGRLFPRPGTGIPADRNRHAVAPDLAGRASAAGGRRGPGGVPAVRGRGQRVHAALVVAARRVDEALLVARIRRAVGAIALGLAWQFVLFFVAYGYGAAWPAGMRAALGVAGIAPLAFAMGMPFALGSVAARAHRAGIRALGVGTQRLRLGDRSDRRGAAGDGVRTARDAADRAGMYLLAAWEWPARERLQAATEVRPRAGGADSGERLR